MRQGKELRSRFFARSRHFDYIPESDKYLFATEAPKYKFNIIGTGANGLEHVRVTTFEGRAAVHGIFDPNPGSIKSAQEAYAQLEPEGSLVVYDSLEEAYTDPEVDGLVISTPNYTHIDVVREVVKSGKHILLEKPMATTIPDAHEILQLANGYGAVFQVGLQYRYKAHYVEAIYEALERRAIGDIKTITIVKHRIPFLDKVSQWNKFSRFSGGTLVEKCCHYFDLFNLFAQSKPVSVFAVGGMAVNFIEFERDGERSDIVDNAMVIVTYENGIRANLNLCMFSPIYHEELYLCGDEGRLRALQRQDMLELSRPQGELEIARLEGQPFRLTTVGYPKYITEAGHGGATFYEHINFVDRIEGRETDAATAEEGFWSVVVGAAAEESVRTGQAVMVDELLEGFDV